MTKDYLKSKASSSLTSSVATSTSSAYIDYHLVITAPGFNTGEHDGKYWIERFLNNLYAGRQPPVSYANHTVSETTIQIDGEAETEVYIQLNASRNLTLAETVPGLIERLFSAQSAAILRNASKFGLLGFRPVPGTQFEEWWNRALFRETYIVGDQVMENFKDLEMKVTDTRWLPVW
ncbi:hypothetical protein ABW19_dt0209376 [Dactylella cylindrospora]|nr:hypothetical protein ABW19_dt0209376 [Dactylella cylindrospora]